MRPDRMNTHCGARRAVEAAAKAHRAFAQLVAARGEQRRQPRLRRAFGRAAVSLRGSARGRRRRCRARSCGIQAWRDLCWDGWRRRSAAATAPRRRPGRLRRAAALPAWPAGCPAATAACSGRCARRCARPAVRGCRAGTPAAVRARRGAARRGSGASAPSRTAPRLRPPRGPAPGVRSAQPASPGGRRRSAPGRRPCAPRSRAGGSRRRPGRWRRGPGPASGRPCSCRRR